MSKRIIVALVGLAIVGGLLLSAQAAVAAEDEGRLAEMLLSAQTPPEQKDAICQKLRITGTARSVPALAALLLDERLSQSARLALEPMSALEAGQALRQALAKSSGKTKAGIINSLGERRELESVPLLVGLLQDSDATVASAAVLALGKIGGLDAAAALASARSKAPAELRPGIVDALLLCADQRLARGDQSGAAGIYRDIYETEKSEHARTAAYRGMVLSAGDGATNLVLAGLQATDRASLMASLQLVREIKGRAATLAFAAILPKAQPPVQMALLEALAQRGDRAAGDAVGGLVSSPTPEVRRAALEALSRLGDASAALLLAEAAAKATGREQEIARLALARLDDPKVGSALLAGLAKAPAAVQGEIVRALGSRQETQAVPELVKMAQGGDESTRLLALKSLAALADESSAGDLIGLLVGAPTDAQRNAAEQALVAACARSPKPEVSVPRILAAMTTAPDAASRAALLRAAGQLGGPQALQALRSATQDPQPTLQDAALRTIAQYAGIEAAGDLLKLAQEQSRPEPQRVLAMRGYWRVVGLARDRAAEERWRLCQAGLTAPQRVEEKRLGLSELSRVPQPEALNLAESLSKEEALRSEAEAACVRIAIAIAGTHPGEARAALQRLEKNALGQDVRSEARKALQAIDQYVGYITAWSAAGPYRQAGKQCPELFDIPFAPEPGQAAQVTWKPLPPPSDASLFWQADLLGVAGGDQCVVYARSRVFSPQAQKVRLDIGSDDGARIWVNGQAVFAKNVMRPINPGDDQAEAALKEGWNDFLVKVTQNNMGCAVCIRLRNPDGTPIPGLRFEAPNNRPGR